MDAITLRPNFNSANSRFSAHDLYANKRARLGSVKYNSVGNIYDKFLASLTEPSVDKNNAYEEVLKKHNMVVYIDDILTSGATGAKKIRVGEIVRDATNNFSSAVAIKRPNEAVTIPQVVEEIQEPVVVKEEPKPIEEEVPMSRTRRHEEEISNRVYHEPVVSQSTESVTNQRLDSYLASGISQAPTSTDEQKLDKLADKLSQIDALTKKTSDLESQENELLSLEREMDEKINAALRKADDDYFSATQSLDEVAKRVNDTEARVRRKTELLERLNKKNIM